MAAVTQLIVQKARLDIQNEDYETPLMLAVYLNHEAIARVFIFHFRFIHFTIGIDTTRVLN